MFNVKESSFCAAPFEAPDNYEPFFAKKSIKMFPKSDSSQSTVGKPKPVEYTTELNQDPNASTMSETSDSIAIDYGLLDYPDPEPDSPDESDSEVDKLYLDLDPPSNYQRRASVNCFTISVNKKVTKPKDGPTAAEVPASGRTASKDKSIDKSHETETENPKKLKDISHGKPGKSKVKSALKSNPKSVEKMSEDKKSRPEKVEKEQEKKSRDGKRRKRRHFVNKATQTEFELIIPTAATTSSVIEQKIESELDLGQEVMRMCRIQEGALGLAGMRDRIWQSRVKRPFEQQPAVLRCSGEEPPAKRERGPKQEEDDSDMDPPIRTIT